MNRLLTVVVDTNHIISSILSSKGASAKLIDWLVKDVDYFRLLLSPPIWNEYITVADWLIPSVRREEKDRIFNILRFHSDWIIPKTQLSICPDENDNRFLECAVEGHADYLVTKNIRHFPRKGFEGVQIVRIGKFLESLEKLENDF